MIIEIYIPCYFGTVLHFESDKLTQAAFHSNWIDQNPYFKRMMLMFGQGTIKPIRIFAGAMFELNLTTFISVIKFQTFYRDSFYLEIISNNNKSYLSN